jgi:hypothetical protein
VPFLLPPVPVLLSVPVLLAVSVWLAVSVLLTVPVLPFSADPFEQPAPIRATVARAASGRSFLIMFFLACDCLR